MSNTNQRKQTMPRSFRWDFAKTRDPNINEFCEFIRFYLWRCPVENVSVKGKTLQELGWSGSDISTLRSQIRKKSSLTQSTFKTVHKVEELEPALESIGHLKSYDLTKEFALCYAGEKLDTEAFFYMIRNAIAHGSFCVRKRQDIQYGIFESRKKDNLRGRAVLRFATLRSIVDIVNHPEKYLNTKKRS